MEFQRLVSLIVLLLIQFSGSCRGEVRFVCPRPQVPNSDVTQGPCDPAGLSTGRDVTDVTPGPLTLQWEETVFRRGSPSRIALKSRSGNSTCVLLDHIPHNDNQFADKGPSCSVNEYPIGGCRRSSTVVTVTIPDIDCDDCYLQLVSVDTSNLASGDAACSIDDSNSTCPVYYSCANIRIRPTTGGEGRSLDSCTAYPENLDGPWPFRPITTYGVSANVFALFFDKDSVMLQGNTVTYDIQPKEISLNEIVAGSPGLYDMPTGAQGRAFVNTSSTQVIFQGRVELSDFLLGRLRTGQLAIGIVSVEDGPILFPLEVKSTKFAENQYLPLNALYTPRGMLRPSDPNFSALTSPYTTPFLQYGHCAMDVRNMNVELTESGGDGQVRGLMHMSAVEYNLFVNGILPRPSDLASDTDLSLSLTKTFVQTFEFTSRTGVEEKFIRMAAGAWIVDGVRDIESVLTLTSGEIPDRAEAALTSGNSSRTFTGTFTPGTSAVVRDEWGEVTGMVTVGFHNRTTLKTNLLVVNFTLPPQLGGLHGPALPGRTGPQLFLPTSGVALRRVADSSWLVGALLTINSAEAIRHMWSGRHYIDMRRTPSTPARAISGQLIPLDQRACFNTDSVACMVTELKPSGFSRGQATVPTNAFVAFLPDDSTGLVDFSIIVRDLQPGETVTSLVLNTGASSVDVTPVLSASEQESGAVEGEGIFSLPAPEVRTQMAMVLSTSRFPTGTIIGSLPVMLLPTQPTFGDQNRTTSTASPPTTSRETVPPSPTTLPADTTTGAPTTSAVTTSVDAADFSLECGTQSDGPMRVSLTTTGGPIVAVYAERAANTCSFSKSSDTTWVLTSARALDGRRCNVQEVVGEGWVSHELTVVVQARPFLRTEDDTRFTLSCNFTSAGVMVASSSLQVRSQEAIRRQEVIRGQVDQQYRLQVFVDSDLGRPVSAVVLGDPITISITMSGTDSDERSMKVSQCVARSSAGDEIMMLDDYCPVLTSVLQEGVGFRTRGTRSDLSGLKAFRLQSSPDDTVIFSCIVEPCSDPADCAGNNCALRLSRQKRQTSEGLQNETTQNSAVRIAFQYRVVGDGDGVVPGPSSRQSDLDTASTQFTLLIAVSVVSALLVITSALVVIALCQLKRLKRQRKHSSKTPEGSS